MIVLFAGFAKDCAVDPCGKEVGSHYQLRNRIWFVGENTHCCAEPTVPFFELGVVIPCIRISRLRVNSRIKPATRNGIVESSGERVDHKSPVQRCEKMAMGCGCDGNPFQSRKPRDAIRKCLHDSY